MESEGTDIVERGGVKQDEKNHDVVGGGVVDDDGTARTILNGHFELSLFLSEYGHFPNFSLSNSFLCCTFTLSCYFLSVVAVVFMAFSTNQPTVYPIRTSIRHLHMFSWSSTPRTTRRRLLLESLLASCSGTEPCGTE